MALIDDWFDEETLISLVPADVYMRGASAVENGAVNAVDRSDVRLVARVEAGDREVAGRVGRWTASSWMFSLRLRRRHGASLHPPHRCGALDVA